MSEAMKTTWRLTGSSTGNCNCAWGCPCQFSALPTHGRCEAATVRDVKEGFFGDVQLGNLKFVQIYSWPGPVHEGNGTHQLIIDERATTTQRDAIQAIDSGKHGGTYFEIFSSVCPHVLEPVYAPISFEMDAERRVARFEVPGLVECRTEPMKNPVTGEELRARIVLPNGFEYKEAETANTAFLRVQSTGVLSFTLENTYAQLHTFDWTNA
jgi:hypothetical protein